MVEAMDGSLLISIALPLLLSLAQHADHFQGTYGWETEWAKSCCDAFHAPDFPPTTAQHTFSIPSINYADPSSPQTFYNPVNVVTDHITFLQVPIDQPHIQFQHLQDIVFHFSFPLHPQPF
jgi:hypothetical protein